jgi:hypothetical protein
MNGLEQACSRLAPKPSTSSRIPNLKTLTFNNIVFKLELNLFIQGCSKPFILML